MLEAATITAATVLVVMVLFMVMIAINNGFRKLTEAIMLLALHQSEILRTLKKESAPGFKYVETARENPPDPVHRE